MDQLRTRVLAGGTGTDLDETTTAPWLDEYEYGQGIDAISGEIKASTALRPFEVKGGGSVDESFNYRLVDSEASWQQEFEESVSAKYNFGSGEVSGSESLTSKVSVSTMSITLVARYSRTEPKYRKADAYELTDEAKKAASDPAKFRERYGDYFVAKTRHGSEYLAIYNCRASSTSSLLKFSTSVKACVTKIFTAEGTAAFEKAVSDNEMVVEVAVLRRGVDPDVTPPREPTNPKEILDDLQWFKAHQKPEPDRVMFMHFCGLDDRLTPHVDVSANDFVETRSLYRKEATVLVAFNGCHRNYKDDVAERVHQVRDRIEAQRNVLVRDADLREELLSEADSVLHDLRIIGNREEFFGNVKTKIASEPEKDKEIEASDTYFWLYGYDRSSLDGVSISKWHENHKEGGHVGHREYTFKWEHPEEYVIVGWCVRAVWDDGSDGRWMKKLGRILTEGRFRVFVRSYYDKGFNWSVTVYYVKASDYRF